jgi:hypothetical protein
MYIDMEKATNYFYSSEHTELVKDSKDTYRIARGGLIDKAIEIAYLEGRLSNNHLYNSDVKYTIMQDVGRIRELQGKDYFVPDDTWPSRMWNKDKTDYIDLSGHKNAIDQ